MALVWVPWGPKTLALQVPDYGGDMKSWKLPLRGALAGDRHLKICSTACFMAGEPGAEHGCGAGAFRGQITGPPGA